MVACVLGVVDGDVCLTIAVYQRAKEQGVFTREFYLIVLVLHFHLQQTEERGKGSRVSPFQSNATSNATSG